MDKNYRIPTPDGEIDLLKVIEENGGGGDDLLPLIEEKLPIETYNNEVGNINDETLPAELKGKSITEMNKINFTNGVNFKEDIRVAVNSKGGNIPVNPNKSDILIGINGLSKASLPELKNQIFKTEMVIDGTITVDQSRATCSYNGDIIYYRFANVVDKVICGEYLDKTKPTVLTKMDTTIPTTNLYILQANYVGDIVYFLSYQTLGVYKKSTNTTTLILSNDTGLVSNWLGVSNCGRYVCYQKGNNIIKYDNELQTHTIILTDITIFGGQCYFSKDLSHMYMMLTDGTRNISKFNQLGERTIMMSNSLLNKFFMGREFEHMLIVYGSGGYVKLHKDGNVNGNVVLGQNNIEAIASIKGNRFYFRVTENTIKDITMVDVDLNGGSPIYLNVDTNNAYGQPRFVCMNDDGTRFYYSRSYIPHTGLPFCRLSADFTK